MDPSDEVCQGQHPTKGMPSVTNLQEEEEVNILQQWHDEALEPIREDVIEWLNITLGCSIKQEGFLLYLDDGIILCHLVRLIHSKALECKSSKDVNVKCKENAQAGTWFARDNIANFLQWCRVYGVKEECMFETEGLVSHRNEKDILLCLLELSRIGMRFGVKPSGLIAMEGEIDKKHHMKTNTNMCSGDANIGIHIDSKSGSPNISDPLTAGKQETLHMEPMKRRATSPLSITDDLDTKVRKVAAACTCQKKFQVHRISEGNYLVGGKNVYLRLLKDRHLMVRVGGGWDTFQHYLSTHDPCRILQFRRDGSPKKTRHESDFLLVKGKYKAQK